MEHELSLPVLGDAESGTVSEWYFEDGAIVEEGQPLAAIDIDKVTVDFAAPVGGRLRIVAEVGAELVIGARLGWIIT